MSARSISKGVLDAKFKKLYALIAQALGAAGFNPTPFLNQGAWFQSYATGSNANDGKTSLTPIKTFAEIRNRWNGGLKGVRPTLPSIPIAITVMDSVVGSTTPQFSDPMSVLWDLDAQPGCQLVINGTTVIKRPGTILAVPNPFSRTSTGQQTVTDAGVADWTADVDDPMHDTTTDSWCWVTKGGTPGTLSNVRAATTGAAGEALSLTSSGLTAAVVAPADAYDILTLPTVYFGAGSSLFRMAGGTDASATGAATVEVRHFHGLAQSTSDALIVDADGFFLLETFVNVGGQIVFAECRFDQGRRTENAVAFMNCASPVEPSNTTQLDTIGSRCFLGSVCSGYSRHFLSPGFGVAIDQDFFLLGQAAMFPGFDGPTGTIFIGNVGRFLNGTAALAMVFMDQSGAYVVQVTTFDAQAVLYGTTSGENILKFPDTDISGMLWASGESAATSFVTDGGAGGTFLLSNSASAFGVNPGTGALVGPTTLTVAHLDAALGAGTGFGKAAVAALTRNMITVGP